MTKIFNPIPNMGQHFTVGAAPAQIMGQHVLPRRRLYGCPRFNITVWQSVRCPYVIR